MPEDGVRESDSDGCFGFLTVMSDPGLEEEVSIDAQMRRAITPDERYRVDWTMVLTDTFVWAGEAGELRREVETAALSNR